MLSLRRVVRNTTALMASSVLGKGVAFLSVLLAARYLGAKGYGLLAFALSFNHIFKVIVGLGFTPLIVKDVARDHSLAVPYLRKVLWIKMFLVIIAFGIISFCINVLGYNGDESTVIYMLFIFIVFHSLADIGFGVLRAFEQIHLVALGEFILVLSVFAGYSLAVYSGADVVAFSLMNAIAGGFCMMYSAAMVRRALRGSDMKITSMVSGFTSARIIRDSLPFALIAAFNLLLLYLDTVMLGILRTQSEVGVYSVAYRMALFLMIVPLAVHFSLVPAFSKLYSIGSDAVAVNVMRAFRYNLIAGVPIGVGGALLAWRVIPPIFGADYYGAALIFAILVWSIVFSFIRYPFVTMFEATDRQSILARILAIAVVLNIVVNLALIPSYGMIGAAIATVVTDMVVMLLLTWQGSVLGVCRLDRDLWARILKVILSAFVMGCVCVLLLDVSLALSIAAAIITYSAMIWLVRALEEEDKILLYRIIKYDR
ncbi:flippase [Nitrospirota bacterium]